VLVLTVDLAVVGARHRDTRNAMVGDPSTLAQIRRGIDLAAHPSWIADVAIKGKPLTFGNLEKAVPDAGVPQDFKDWVDAQFDPSVTWQDIAWVRRHWDGKLVVKGILDPEDARKAADAGADAVVVSNHGGRQLDAVPSTALALPAVVDAIGDQVEVLADGGVRTGLDVVKFMSMGARAVMLGRAWAWALGAGGESAVANMLQTMKADIDTALGLTGRNSVDDLDAGALYRRR
jgi:L-lactate dehydrogenase (cytochrome)